MKFEDMQNFRLIATINIECILLVSIKNNIIVAFSYVEYYKKGRFTYFMYLGNRSYLNKDDEHSKILRGRIDHFAAIALGGYLFKYITSKYQNCRDIIVAVDSEDKKYTSRERLYRSSYKKINPRGDIYTIENLNFIEPITYIWKLDDSDELICTMQELLDKQYHPIPLLYIPIKLSEYNTPPSISKNRIKLIIRTLLMESYINAYDYNENKHKNYKRYVRKFYEVNYDAWPNFFKLKSISQSPVHYDNQEDAKIK